MPLGPANQPQLIRSSQKDEYYQTNLTNNANELFHTLAGKSLPHTLHAGLSLLSTRGTSVLPQQAMKLFWLLKKDALV
uniref:Uncharacterized protein n=1 Tax=Cyprinus carpio TaxID=7962 RepID=A0A8C1LK26_CYPCA